MRGLVRMSAVAGIVIGLLSPTAVYAGTRVETGRYYVQGADCFGNLLPADSDGCFDLTGNEVLVDLALEDDFLPGPVGGFYVFFGKPGQDLLGSGGFCGSVADVPVPPGATSIWVGATLECGAGTYSLATVGTITATFTTA